MSQEVRDMLASSANIVYQNDSQPEDIRDQETTQTYLISLLQQLHGDGWYFCVTSLVADHSDDSDLGPHGHSGGFAVDLWPLNSPTPGDYMDANDPAFAEFLSDLASYDYLHQIGLAGTAITDANIEAAGETCFLDEGADHIHVGAREDK